MYVDMQLGPWDDAILVRLISNVSNRRPIVPACQT